MRRSFFIPFIYLFSALVAHAETSTPRPELALQIGHSSQVTAIAMSPGGRMGASGSYDKTVKIWDARNGGVLHTIEEPQPAIIWSLKFSPDSSLLAVVSTGLPLRDPWNKRGAQVRLYSTRTGALWRLLPKIVNGAFSLAFSPDGHWLATGGDDSGVDLWNAQTGAQEKSLKGHTGWGDALVFTQQGKHLLSASTQDQTLREWDTATGELLRTVAIDVVKSAAIALSADGALLAFGRPIAKNKDKVSGDVTVCDTRTGGVLHVLTNTPSTVGDLSFTPDSQTLAVNHAVGTLNLWNPRTGTLLKSVAATDALLPTCAAFSPNGQSLAVGASNGDVALYNAAQPTQPQLRCTLRGGIIGFQYVSFSTDGRTLTSETMQFSEGSGTRRVWDAQNGTLQSSQNLKFEIPQPQNSAALRPRTALSPDGALRVAPVSVGDAKIEDAKTGAVLRPLKNSAGTRSFVFINGGKSLAGHYSWKPEGSWNKSLRVWDVATGETVLTTEAQKYNILDICVSPDGALLASSDGYSIRIWDARSDQIKPLRTIVTGYTFGAYITFAPDSATLAASCFGKILLYNARSGALLHALNAHSGTTYSASFSLDSQRLATCGDSTVKIWDTKSGRLLATLFSFPPNIKTGAEDYLALTPEGYYSGSAAADRYVRFRLGDTLYPAESFQARYYRPDLVKKAFNGENLPPIGDFKGPFPPVAKLGANTEKITGDTISVTLAATDDSAVKSVAFFINGARVDAKPITADSRPLTADSRALTADSKALTADARPLVADSRTIPEAHKTITRYTATLPLPPGASNLKVQAIAFDDDGLQSPREEILFSREATAVVAGKLLGLCVGVSQYQDARLNLKFADADANSLTQTLGAQRGIYSEAKISALTNEKATASTIKSQLDALIQTSTRADTVFLSLSGHGWRDDERNFYFATAEVNRNDISHSALPWKEITDRLTQLSQRSKRVIVLLDACHSGSAATNEELVKAILSANAGVLVFASSRGNEVSLENAEWQHGAFTKALIEAMEGKATAAGENKTTMLDFLSYVSRRVKSLTEDQQHPQVPFLQDFDTDAALMQKP